MNAEEIVNQFWKQNVPLQENHNNRVGAMYEDNFMCEVENLNQPRQQREPERYEEMYTVLMILLQI